MRILDVDTEWNRIGLRLAHPAAASEADLEEGDRPGPDTSGSGLGSLASAFKKARDQED